MTSGDDAIAVIREQLCGVVGVLMARGGLDEQAAFALVLDEWMKRDVPLSVVAGQLLQEAVDDRS